MKPNIKNQIYVYYLADWRFSDPNSMKDEDWFCFASKYNNKKIALKNLYNRWKTNPDSISLHEQFALWNVYKVCYRGNDYFKAVSDSKGYKYIKNIRN